MLDSLDSHTVLQFTIVMGMGSYYAVVYSEQYLFYEHILSNKV